MTFLEKVKTAFQKGNSVPAAPSMRDAAAFGKIERKFTACGPSIWSIHPDVQRAIQEGSHLNMKAVLRGMRRTGKSTILSQLCGYSFLTNYVPSPGISAGTLYYRSCAGRNGGVFGGGDGAKVELWDVVDEGFSTTPMRKKAQNPNLFDARSIDVYRGCHLAAFVIDRTRRESLEYAVRGARHVPPNTCVLFILNFFDAPKDLHVVSECDVDAACRNLRRATTPMILAASAGRLPPTDYSVSATWVSISAATGHGMESLYRAFEIPFTLLRVLTLESHIHSCFQFIEEHRARLFIERAELQVVEKEKRQQASQRGKNEEEETVRSYSRGDGVDPPLYTKEKGCTLPLNVMVGGRIHERVEEEDENGIAKDFFNDLIDEEEEKEGGDGLDVDANANAKEWSSDNNDSFSNKQRRRKAMTDEVVVVAETSIAATIPSTPPPTLVESFPSVSLGACGTTDACSTAEVGSAPVSLQHGGPLKEDMLDDAIRVFDDGLLDVGDNCSFDVAFFGSGASVDDSSAQDAVVSDEGSGDDATEKLLTNTTNTHLPKPKDMTVGSMNNTPSEPDTPSIHADVNILLQQMERVLGVTAVEEGSAKHARHQKKKKSHTHHKKKEAKRRDEDYTGEGLLDGKNILTDDGTFEVIRE